MLTMKDVDYQQARNKFIPQATEHADALERAMLTLPLVTQRDQALPGRIHALAFSNEMQRQCFKAGLIAYDPRKSAHYQSETELLKSVRARLRNPERTRAAA